MNLDAWLSRGEAAFVAGVSVATVSHWHARGWVDQTGERRHLTVKRRPNGKLGYRLGDVLDAERDTSTNPNSHRGLPPALLALAAAA